MKAVVMQRPGEVVVEHGRPRPERQPGCALIRVNLAGVCRTDMELVRGYMNFTGVLGHEFVGTVEEADDGSLIGRRVVGEINIECGRCDMCRRGLGRHCRHVRVLGINNWDGAFAEWIVLPERNLHVVPDGVSDRQAVFVEPIAAAVEILEQVAVRPTDRVAVVGDGRLGLLCAQVLKLTGCDLTVIGRHADKLAIVEGANVRTMLADDVSTAPAPEAPPLLGRFDVVVEATGRRRGLALAADLVRPRGTLVLKTTIADAVPVNLADIVVREVQLVGSRCGPFPPALRLLAEGHIKTEPFIQAEFSLADGVQALEYAARPGVLKVLIHCNEGRTRS